ncbi:DUF927 domain-containing protein [Methylobacterium longum]|uniref:DUF927 domain-containing protein n=1 Tax=Methylobacterium longum TaxID=767694 RepID=A0ABT8AT32_9HYPH|nr:DUF927 domain-containing protein [Methylobacterium longum]MDN3573107.1 DUF927 domain-containing protein [Methylobacterium longum]GJE12080.1 hypothetical protein FOHLNKBM_3126 [Methylobacterium longum]
MTYAGSEDFVDASGERTCGKLSTERSTYISTDRFRMNTDGLTTEITRGSGERARTEQLWVSAPFEIIGRGRDPSGCGWSKWLRWRDPDGRQHEHAVSDAALHGDVRALAADLASRGLVIARGARNHLADYLAEVSVDERVTTVTRSGWHTLGDSRLFVLPHGAIGQPHDETVILSGAISTGYAESGTLQGWRESVGALAHGHNRLILAIATALAGPLLELAGSEGGGINLYGQSSKGKTTALRAAASVWGRGSADPGFIRSWRATANAQEGAAALVTDTLLCLDEIGVADGRDAAAAIYQLASGVGKGRSSRDGSLRPAVTWRVLTLSTGEIPMAAKVTEDKQRRVYAGQSVRLLDIPADAGQGFGVFDHAGADGNAARLAEAVKSAAQANFGTAGPAFVREMIRVGLDEVARRVAKIVSDFLTAHVDPAADGQVRRAAGRLGLIAAAGELGTEFGILPWDRGESECASARALQDWLATRGGTEPAEVREAIAQVRRFFEAYGDSRFELIGDADARPILNRVGWRRGYGEERLWLVLPEAWKSEVCAGLDPVATARILSDRGMLKPAGSSKFQRSERTPVSKDPIRVYVVTPAIFGGDEDA